MAAKRKLKRTKPLSYLNLSIIIISILLSITLSIKAFASNRGGLLSAARGGGPKGGVPTVTAAPTPTPVPGELLTNTSFEINSDNDSQTPDGWVQHYDQPNRLAKVVCNLSLSGNCSYYVDGKHFNAIKQYVSYSAPAGSTVTVSGWGKGEKVADNTNPAEGSFWVQAWIHYTDGSTEYGLHADFDNGTHGFQKAEKSFTVPKPIEGFTYFVKFGKSGYAWFDDVSLTVK